MCLNNEIYIEIILPFLLRYDRVIQYDVVTCNLHIRGLEDGTEEFSL